MENYKAMGGTQESDESVMEWRDDGCHNTNWSNLD